MTDAQADMVLERIDMIFPGGYKSLLDQQKRGVLSERDLLDLNRWLDEGAQRKLADRFDIPEGTSAYEAKGQVYGFRSQAEAYFKNPANLRPRPAVPVLAADATIGELAEKTLKNTDLLVFAETHTDVSPRQVIAGNWQAWKKGGVTNFYLELPHDKNFPLGFANLPGSPAPAVSESMAQFFARMERNPAVFRQWTGRTEELSRMGGAALADAVDVGLSAAENGVKVHLLDTRFANPSGGGLGPSLGLDLATLPGRQKRLKYFNYAAVKGIEAAQQANPGKGILLVGRRHAYRSEGVWGIPELTGGIGIDVVDRPVGGGRGITIHPRDSGGNQSFDFRIEYPM